MNRKTARVNNKYSKFAQDMNQKVLQAFPMQNENALREAAARLRSETDREGYNAVMRKAFEGDATPDAAAAYITRWCDRKADIEMTNLLLLADEIQPDADDLSDDYTPDQPYYA